MGEGGRGLVVTLWQRMARVWGVGVLEVKVVARSELSEW